MSDWITGRNPVYEVLKSKRRQIHRLWIAQGGKIQGRLAEIIDLAQTARIPVEIVKRSNLDGIDPHHQALALECSAYPYANLEDIIGKAKSQKSLCLSFCWT